MGKKLSLKRKRGEPWECAASRCKAQATVELGAGVFSQKGGPVPLCDKHYKAYCDSQEAAPVQPDPEPAAQGVRMDTTEPAPPQADADMVAFLDLTIRDQMAAETGEAEATLQMLRDMAVGSQADVDFANEALGDVKAKLKAYEALRKKATKRTRETLEEIRGWFKPSIDFYKEAESTLKVKIRDGLAALEAQRTAQIEAASIAHQQGNLDEVESMVKAANEAEAHQPDNISLVEHYEFRIESPDLVVRELCSPDPAKIRAYLKLHGAAAINATPGIKVWREDTVVRR